MSGSVPSLLWTIVIIVIILIVIIVLLKVVFAIIAIAPIAYAQTGAEPAPSWPGGIAPAIGTFGTPNLSDVANLVPGGPAWGLPYPIILN